MPEAPERGAGRRVAPAGVVPYAVHVVGAEVATAVGTGLGVGVVTATAGNAGGDELPPPPPHDESAKEATTSGNATRRIARRTAKIDCIRLPYPRFRALSRRKIKRPYDFAGIMQ